MNVIQINLIFDINKLSYGNNPKEIILHHADAYNCSVEDVHNWHKNQNWAGIGYHYFIKKSGEIYKGREDNMIGSHCLGHNKDTIGICFEGKYTEETMPEAQIEAGRELINYLKKKYGISKINRHKDYNSTDCPGSNFPFNEIINSDVVNYEKKTLNDWIKRLQQECNNQGFSNQNIDGIYGPNTLAGCPSLKYGASGNITKLLQERLINLGYSCGPCSIDGEFGPSTRVAVMKFQKNNKLEVDGIVGKNTWRMLLTI